MTYHASPEALSLETFEAIRDTIEEQFCSTCWDRKCEACNVHKLIQNLKERVT